MIDRARRKARLPVEVMAVRVNCDHQPMETARGTSAPEGAMVMVAAVGESGRGDGE